MSGESHSVMQLLPLDVAAELTLDECMLRGFGWFRSHLLPLAQELRKSPASSPNAAWVLSLTADVYYVIDCIEEATRWYRFAAKRSRQTSELEQEIADAQELIKFRRENVLGPVSGDPSDELNLTEEAARLTVCRAAGMCRPSTGDLPTDISRPWAKLLRARCHAVANRDAEAFREFHAAVRAADELFLLAADLFFLPTGCWECVSLWNTLYRRRKTIQDLGLTNFNRTVQRVGPPELSQIHESKPRTESRKARELVLRFHLHRTGNNRRGLERLAAEYPQWSDVTYSLQHFDEYGRAPLKQELLQWNRNTTDQPEEKT